MSLDLIQAVAAITTPMTRPEHEQLATQLRSATTTLCMRFAEGIGRGTPKERLRAFNRAVAAADEISMILDLVHSLDLVDVGPFRVAKRMTKTVSDTLCRVGMDDALDRRLRLQSFANLEP